MNKHCPLCQSTILIPLSSTDEFICDGCKRTFPWRLKLGQESVLIHGKIGTKEEEKI